MFYKMFELYRTFEFWPKCQNESSSEREETAQGSNNFVRPTEIFDISRFEISRVFVPKEVRNVQGTEEFVRAIEKFEKLSIRVFENQLYIHPLIDDCVIQINLAIKFSEVWLLKIRLCGGDNLLFGCFYRSPTTTSTSEKNNVNLNNLLKYLSEKKYSHQCFVGDFNFRNINWFMWTTPHNEESKEAQFIKTILDCYLYQHLLESKY